MTKLGHKITVIRIIKNYNLISLRLIVKLIGTDT